jgi:hypothetical protein
VSRSSEDGGSYAAHLEDLHVPDATFGCPDLTTFCRLRQERQADLAADLGWPPPVVGDLENGRCSGSALLR